MVEGNLYTYRHGRERMLNKDRHVSGAILELRDDSKSGNRRLGKAGATNTYNRKHVARLL
jgi:hypothetical protein